MIRKNLKGAILFSLFFILLVNNATAFELITRDVIEKEVVTDVDLIKTVDNFIIMFDGSATSNQLVPGSNTTKIAAAKALLEERNQWLPDLGYSCGLYLLSGWKSLKTLYPAQKYDREKFGQALAQLPDKGKGNNLVQQGLLELEKILDHFSGRTAIIFFTDGTYSDSGYPKKPIEIAAQIARKHNVRFYLISSAEQQVQTELLKRVATINAASRVIPIQNFFKRVEYLSGMLFTAKVSSYVKFTAKKEVLGLKLENILFESNSNTISSQYAAELDRLGDFLQKSPQAYVVLQGFSDNSGLAEKNMELSFDRVMQVAGYLMKNFEIDESRIVTLWYGDLNPAADNATPDGRRRNRRVEIAVDGIDVSR